jgi:hypothetical protein
MAEGDALRKELRKKAALVKSTKGRPTKFKPTVRKAILDAVKAGNRLTVAAARAGISKPLLHQWLLLAGKCRQLVDLGDTVPVALRPYVRFLAQIEKAEAEAELRSVEIIRKAAENGQWTAAAWWLERTNPEGWAKRERHEHTGANGGPIEIVDPKALFARVYGSNPDDGPVIDITPEGDDTDG